MNEPREPIRAFIDGVDFLHELGQAPDGNKVYPTIDNLKAYSSHDLTEGEQACGIAEVEIRFIRWVEEPK